MSKKFLVVNANGAYEENLGYGTEEFIDASLGVASAGSPVVLGPNGKLDSSIVDSSVVDHDTTNGAAASTVHTAFPLLDGTRPFTGIQSYSSVLAVSADTNLVHKKYVDDLVAGEAWQEPVETRTATPPGSPATGERYLIIPTATGAWVGQEDNIAEWNGTGWDYYTPSTGWKVVVNDEDDGIYLYTGSAWQKQSYETTTASNGCIKVGVDIQIDPLLAGDGLAFNTGVMSVNVDDSSIETDSDTLRVKALGITNAMLAGSITSDKLVDTFIKGTEVDDVTLQYVGSVLSVKDNGINDQKIDFGTGLNQVNAADVPIIDAGDFTDTTNVENSLQEIYEKLQLNGVTYEAAVGGVSIGDLVYISADDTVSTYSTISTYHKAIGLASATVAAGSNVIAMANDTRLENVISGATAGDVYYWDGSSLVNSMPTTSGSHVIQCGVAINATDLAVEVRPVKKNI